MGGFRIEMLAQRFVAAERFVCKPDRGADVLERAGQLVMMRVTVGEAIVVVRGQRDTCAFLQLPLGSRLSDLCARHDGDGDCWGRHYGTSGAGDVGGVLEAGRGRVNRWPLGPGGALQPPRPGSAPHRSRYEGQLPTPPRSTARADRGPVWGHGPALQAAAAKVCNGSSTAAVCSQPVERSCRRLTRRETRPRAPAGRGVARPAIQLGRQ